MKNFTNANLRKKVIKPEQAESTDVWSLPSVEQVIPEDQQKTNALGKKPTWRYEPPEEVEEEVQPLTAEEIEEIRQAAYQEGFNQGKEEGFSAGFDEGQKAGFEEGNAKGQEQGLAQGLEEGQTQITELASQWQQLNEQLFQPLTVVENQVEQELITLVAQLTQAITHHEAKTNPDILLSAISEGMKALPSKEPQTQILLHPEDIQLVSQQFGEEHIQEQGWRLLPAPQLARGSCQIENSTSNIDLSIKSRINDVLESFLQQALYQ